MRLAIHLGDALRLVAVEPAFTSEELERSFTEPGYVVADALTPDDVTELLELYEATAGETGSGFHYSMELETTQAKQAIRAGLVAMYHRRLAGLLADHVVLAPGFVVKAASGDSTVAPHLDRGRSVAALAPAA